MIKIQYTVVPKILDFSLWKNERNCIKSVIRQKDVSQNGCLKRKKHAKFSEKRTFLTSWYVHVSRIRTGGCPNTEKYFVIWYFSWNTRFEIRPSALLPTIIYVREYACCQVRSYRFMTSSKDDQFYDPHPLHPQKWTTD